MTKFERQVATWLRYRSLSTATRTRGFCWFLDVSETWALIGEKMP